MGFLGQQKSRHGNKEYQKLPGNKAKHHHVPKIGRYKESGDNSSAGQNTEQQRRKQSIKNQGADNSDQTDLSSNQRNSTSAAANTTSEHDNFDQTKEEFMPRGLDTTLPRFGPCFGEDSEAIKAAKNEALENVLNNENGDGKKEPASVFLQAIKNIVNEARDAYDPDIVGHLKKSEFRWMMIKDGCFFLQLAFSILGGSELLGFPEYHAFFGTHGDDKRTSQWIKAMYFIGNQIPCVVLRELMKQNFFQSVIRMGFRRKIWPCHQLDLPKRVLYLMVVEPELKNLRLIPSSGLFSKLKFQKQEAPYSREQPSYLLHACHCLVLGTGHHTQYKPKVYARDLEGGDRDLPFPSATELRKSGIKFGKAKNGIKEIHFGRFLRYWGGCLYVPPFTIDGETEHILHYLECYEQQLDMEKREVTTYLRFITDLVQSSTDFWVLENEGIIEVKKTNHAHNFPKTLDMLAPSKEIPLSLDIRLVRLQIMEYLEVPRNLVSLVLFLTVVQTIFTILGYFVPRN